MQNQSGHNHGDPPAALSPPIHIEFQLEKQSHEHLKVQSQSRQSGGHIPPEGAKPGLSLLPPSSGLSFSSSSDSSFGSNSRNNDPFSDLLTKPELYGGPSPASAPGNAPDFSTPTPAWSMVSSTPRNANGDLTSSELFSQNLDSSHSNASSMRIPPTQTMGQPAAYDPNRIPASVFASKPSTPMEWSIASNDSLFSIHVGNNSLSRDHFIQLGKSGELLKSGEFIKPEESNGPPLPNRVHVSEAKNNESNKAKSIKMQDNPPIEEKHPKNLRVITEEKMEKHDNKVSPAEEVRIHSPINTLDGIGSPAADRNRTLSSPPRLSTESGKSNSSFAFPVLVKDIGSSASLPPAPEKPKEPPQPQPELPKATTKAAAAENSRYSWLCCWPRCC